jgi:hypothetical protein
MGGNAVDLGSEALASKAVGEDESSLLKNSQVVLGLRQLHWGGRSNAIKLRKNLL